MGESARLGRNFAAVAVAQFVAHGLTFVLSVMIARRLGPDLYGLFAFGFAFPSLLLLLVSAGLNDVVAIDVAARPSCARSYLTTVAAVRLVLAALAGVVLWISVGVLLDDALSRTVTLVLGLSALLQAYASTFVAFFRAFERLEYMALVVLIERGFTVGVAVVILWLGYGLFEIALAFLAGAGVMLAAAMVILRRKFIWFSPGLERGIALGITRRAIPFALGGAISTFTASIGPVFLALLRGPAETGLFNAGMTLLLAALSILSLYNVVLLPLMARIRAAGSERLAPVLQDTQRFLFALGLPAAAGAAVYAKEIMTLFYGPAFIGGTEPFRLLMVTLAIVCACLGNGAVLAASGRMITNLYVGAVGTIVMVGLSIVLIPGHGPLGAAAAFLVGSGVAGVLGTTATRRYVVRIDLSKTLLRPVVAGGIMSLLLLLVQPPLWLGVPLGALVYAVSLYAVGGVQNRDWIALRDAMNGALGRGE